jgi:Fic/DOC family
MPENIQVRLADALERAHEHARREVVKSASLRRPDRELLLARGYLQDICKGWYLLTRPTQRPGESTAWYAVFWDFVAVYLGERFKNDYCLSAIPSLEVHIGSNVIPRQVIAITARAGKTMLELPHQTSLLVYQDSKNLPRTVEVVNDLRVMPLPMALCRMPVTFFQTRAMDAEIALRAVKSVDDLIRVILESGSSGLAARFAGAYQFLGDEERAQQITKSAVAAGIACQPENPFAQTTPVFVGTTRLISPYAGRIEAMFRTMRQPVLEAFKDYKVGGFAGIEAYLQHVEDVYEHDAYNSLSIEGYQVTPELIERIRLGRWNPDHEVQDREQIAAMAAKGYWEAFRSVKKSVRRVLEGGAAAAIVRSEYQEWYRALFSPSVQAGLLEAYRLAGHRNGRVFIRASRHVPPPSDAVADAMTALFGQLQDEPEAIVRGVLGHFLFGFIHPYFDGNGRMARFLMNVMLASGQYPWTIIRTTQRNRYLNALEAASAEQNIVPFAQFIREEMSVDWTKEPKRA